MTTVYASADPVVIRNYAVLSMADLPADDCLRISYSHINGMAESLTLAVVVLNAGPDFSKLEFRGGYAGPDRNSAAVGHAATASFFRERATERWRSYVLSSEENVALIARGFAPQEWLCGIFEIRNLSTQSLRVAVVACGVGVAPTTAVGMLPMIVSISGKRDDEWNFKWDASVPLDLPATSTSAGVLSTFSIEITNGTRTNISANLLLETVGFSSATLEIDGTLFEITSTPPNSFAILKTVVIPPTGCTVSIVAMTDLNAPGPSLIRFVSDAARANGPSIAALPTESVMIDSSGSSARGVAAATSRIPRSIAASRVAEPLASAVIAEAHSLTPHHYRVIIEINQSSRPVVALARAAVQWMLWKVGIFQASRGPTDATHPYFFAAMTAAEVVALLDADDELARRSRMRPLIARIWQDHVVTAAIVDSIPTVKADAVHTSFGAFGAGIVWAVIDSGVERHSHFQEHQNLVLPDGLSHRDYLGAMPMDISINALVDDFGHGTHVAGIIAGEWTDPAKPIAGMLVRDEGTHLASYVGTALAGKVGGVAPKCKIVSMRVLDAMGTGSVSNVITALEDVLAINDYGRNIRIHGVNLSIGYTFHPDWEACGATPICAVVDRLVASGVIVVVAAGNSGNIILSSEHGGSRESGAAITINDPGNAARAITVGSCYKKAPHTLGIAASSSKGPTSDGRPKPDLVAPGERVLSCAASVKIAAAACKPPIDYIEDSGTSMAAPHVSGAAAAYLSARTEFIGRPDDVKALMMKCATDLNRDPSFQGSGLIDIFRMFVNS